MEYLRLVKPTLKHKQSGIEYIEEHYRYNSNIHGSGGLDRYLNNYQEWIIKLKNDISNPGPGRVRALIYFLIRESDSKIIGMINIRLELNDQLRRSGGHIGYSIRPTERRKGYNKINLYLALEICHQYGLEEVILDCEKKNLGSSKTMQALGGKLISEYIDENNLLCQRYNINVSKSLKEYYNLYSQSKNLKKVRK